jgi:hypothetical protein
MSYRAIPIRVTNPLPSCSPNALVRCVTSSFSLEVRAVRHIRAGEEVTGSLIDELTQPCEMRRAVLGFHCTCPVCEDSAKTDPMRVAWGESKLPIVARVENAEGMIRSLEAAGLQRTTYYHMYVGAAAARFEKEGNRKKARMYRALYEGLKKLHGHAPEGTCRLCAHITPLLDDVDRPSVVKSAKAQDAVETAVAPEGQTDGEPKPDSVTLIEQLRSATKPSGTRGRTAWADFLDDNASLPDLSEWGVTVLTDV